METIIVTGQIGPRWIAFKDGADLSEYDPEKLTTWTVTGKTPTTGSVIRAQDGMNDVDADLEKEQYGLHTIAAFESAYSVSFALEHAEKIVNDRGGNWGNLTRATLLSEEIPLVVLNQYVRRVDPSQSASSDDMAALKKPKDTKAAKKVQGAKA